MTKIHEVTEEALAELKAKHGERKVRTFSMPTPDGVIEVALLKPSRREYERYRKQLFDDAKRDVATENLIRSHVLSPEKAKFEELLEEFPALCDSFGKPFSEWIGGGGNAEVGK